MEYQIVALPEGINYYFNVLMFFLGGYWIAYIFKNLSNLLQSQGIIKFVILMSFFFAVSAVLLPIIEAERNFVITGAYIAGFFLRFFRYDH